MRPTTYKTVAKHVPNLPETTRCDAGDAVNLTRIIAA
jgi:hypothetical protein